MKDAEKILVGGCVFRLAGADGLLGWGAYVRIRHEYDGALRAARGNALLYGTRANTAQRLPPLPAKSDLTRAARSAGLLTDWIGSAFEPYIFTQFQAKHFDA